MRGYARHSWSPCHKSVTPDSPLFFGTRNKRGACFWTEMDLSSLDNNINYNYNIITADVEQCVTFTKLYQTFKAQ